MGITAGQRMAYKRATGGTQMSSGWDTSAAAWIAHMGEHGDFGRQFVLDAPMLARIGQRDIRLALDVGCGEGRFCRMLAARGIRAIGIDPTAALLERARQLHPEGDYRAGRAEALDFPDASFDLVVSYLTLIDIDDVATAIAEMARVLRPGGMLLIANLTSFVTASVDNGWHQGADSERYFRIDHYLEERASWIEWGDIRIRNWHRPLSRYMALLLEAGLVLRHFEEPAPTGGDAEKAARYRRVPWFYLMEWEKPAA
jgi:SAM-dependent methyltransferase